MSKIRIRNGPYSGREKTLASDAMSIGRDAEAGLQILDRSASRFHAEVFPVGGMYFVRDLESKNGTYVNDERLTDEELLREGDVIKIGTTEIIFESGIALNDDDSSDRISYQDDADMLSNTLEFKIDDLSDIEDEADEPTADESRNLQILYQVGRLLSRHEGYGVAAEVLDFLLRAMPAESALIFQRQGDSGKLVPHTVRTAKPNSSPVICRTIIRRTIADNRAFFTADAQEDERFNRKESVISKGIRSVVCVPLTISGQSRGVLYVSRGIGALPFEKADMEVLSACAIQLGLAFDASEQDQAARRTLAQVVAGLVRGLETGSKLQGMAERTAGAAVTLAKSLQLSRETCWHLQLAGLLHHLPQISGAGDIETILEPLNDIEELEEVLPLVRLAGERLDGKGPLGLKEDQQDIENRILSLAAAFAVTQIRNPDADVVQILEQLAADPGYDGDVADLLKSCHLDGSLYQTQVV